MRRLRPAARARAAARRAGSARCRATPASGAAPAVRRGTEVWAWRAMIATVGAVTGKAILARRVRPTPHAAFSLHRRDLPGHAAHRLAAVRARLPLSRLFPPLARTLRPFSRSPSARQHLGACGVGGRGQRRAAADPVAAPPLCAAADGGDHGDADRLAARAQAVRRRGVPRLSALRPAARGHALPRPGATRAGGGDGNRDLAQPVPPVRSARHSAGGGQRAAVGTLAARLRTDPAAGAAGAAQRVAGRGPVARRRTPLPRAGRGAGTRQRGGQSQVRHAAAQGRARTRRGAARVVGTVAASTHEREELAVFEAHLAVLARLPDALLLIAPRHPERFRAVEHSARNLGFTVATHGAGDAPGSGCQCFVINAMGVLMRYFAAADLAFVGGSLVPIGGHNVLEPAALSRPVLVGPHTFNFEEITRSLIEAGGARRVASARELGTTLLQLLRDPAERFRMGAAARAVCARERGAVRRTMVLLGRIYARSHFSRSAECREPGTGSGERGEMAR